MPPLPSSPSGRAPSGVTPGATRPAPIATSIGTRGPRSPTSSPWPPTRDSRRGSCSGSRTGDQRPARRRRRAGGGGEPRRPGPVRRPPPESPEIRPLCHPALSEREIVFPEIGAMHTASSLASGAEASAWRAGAFVPSLPRRQRIDSATATGRRGAPHRPDRCRDRAPALEPPLRGGDADLVRGHSRPSSPRRFREPRWTAWFRAHYRSLPPTSSSTTSPD